MQSNNYLIVVESWKLSWGMQVDIQHSLNGLASGTILQSEETGKKWEVDSRVRYINSDNPKRFKGEKESFQHYKFESMEYYEDFVKKIKDNEDKGIYSYLVKPIDHSDKPVIGEKLIIRFN